MHEIDFSAVASNALSCAEQLLAEWLPDGKPVGAEWTALNPMRSDSRPGSFKVNLRTGNWGDFASGDKGGDLVSLFAYLFTGGKQGEAAKQLAERLGISTAAMGTPGRAQRGERKNRKPRHEWTPILPVPNNVEEPPTAHYHNGRYSTRWPYFDLDGSLIGYTCRFDRKDKPKEVLPLTWCRNEVGAEGWQWRSFEIPRPLFGLEQLQTYPDEAILLVEGEKCAQAGQGLLDMPVMSWIGGSKAVGKIDFTHLAGRRVVLWPDNDDPGFRAMRDIAAKLEGIADDVLVILPPDGRPKGWDIADAIGEDWTGDNILDAIDRAISVEDFARWFRERGGEAGNGKTPREQDFAAPAYAPSEWHHTDYGGALRLAAVYGDQIRYNARPFGRWFWYDSTRWCEDVTNKVFSYLDAMINDILAEASRTADNEERKALAKWGFKLEGMSRQKAVVSKAETLQDLSVRVDQLDSDGLQFNCANGTLDLHDGEVNFREHRVEDYLTKLSPVVYDPDAICPNWLRFIIQIFNHDEGLAEFNRRAVGYSLTSDVSEQCMFFCYGTGANGKSVFFETLRYVFGDYGGKAPTEMLMQQIHQQVPTDVADLRGKRFVVASEVDEGKRWAESRLKDLTGGDTIKARRMREDYFEFPQTHKLWVFGNHKPVLKGTDEGVKRRIRIVPFTVTIPPEKRIPMSQLLATFRREASGILNWALGGYMKWCEEGLGMSDAVRTATDEYFDDNDILQTFIDENCLIGQHYTSTIAKTLYGRYHYWCETNGIRSLSSKGFYRMLAEKGYEKRIGTGNKSVFDGIALNDDEGESEK